MHAEPLPVQHVTKRPTPVAVVRPIRKSTVRSNDSSPCTAAALTPHLPCSISARAARKTHAARRCRLRARQKHMSPLSWQAASMCSSLMRLEHGVADCVVCVPWALLTCRMVQAGCTPRENKKVRAELHWACQHAVLLLAELRQLANGGKRAQWGAAGHGERFWRPHEPKQQRAY